MFWLGKITHIQLIAAKKYINVADYTKLKFLFFMNLYFKIILKNLFLKKINNIYKTISLDTTIVSINPHFKIKDIKITGNY